MPSSDVQEGAILYALHQGSLVPVASDASGNLTAVIRGLDGTTLRTVRVDSGGQLFALIHGQHGTTFLPIRVNAAGEMMTRIFGSHPVVPIASDADGFLATRIFGHDGAVLRVIRTTAAGEMISVLRGISGHNADVDAVGRLIMKVQGQAEGAWRNSPSGRYKSRTHNWAGDLGASFRRDIINITGDGIFMGAADYIDGTTIDARESLTDVFIDGETSPSIRVRHNSARNDATKNFDTANVTGTFGATGRFDNVGFIYVGDFRCESHFRTSLRVVLQNGPGGIHFHDYSCFYALWV